MCNYFSIFELTPSSAICILGVCLHFLFMIQLKLFKCFILFGDEVYHASVDWSVHLWSQTRNLDS